MVVTMAGAVALLGVITAPWQLFAVYLVMATSWACLSSTGLSSTLLPWFGRRQGVAMTLALTGASVGGMVLVPILVALTQRRGFAFAPGALAAALLAIGLPLVHVVIRDRPSPADVARELARDGAPAFPRERGLTDRTWTRQQVLRVPRLWTTVAALPGRIALGVLADRVDLRALSAVNIGAQGAALAAMAAWPTPATLVGASLVFGLGVGNLITFPPLLAAREEFGPRSFGTVFGLLSAATQVGVALGPGLMGLLHDVLGYRSALWWLVALEAVAAVSVLAGRAAPRDP